MNTVLITHTPKVMLLFSVKISDGNGFVRGVLNMPSSQFSGVFFICPKSTILSLIIIIKSFKSSILFS